jgi:DNA-binding HxlR family transcriptional regulator
MMHELLADITHFNELERGLPGVSRPLLAERLRRLVQAEVLDRINPSAPITHPEAQTACAHSPASIHQEGLGLQ